MKKSIILLLIIFTLQSTEITHYDSLVISYNEKRYEILKRPLTHTAYVSYNIKAVFPELKARNKERPGQIDFHIGLFNEIKYDSTTDWGESVVANIKTNQDLKNYIAIFEEGLIGQSIKYYAVLHGHEDPVDNIIALSHIEYKVGYIKLGRMMTMQITLLGDINNKKLVETFYNEMNLFLSTITDENVKICDAKIKNSEAWKKVKFTKFK